MTYITLEQLAESPGALELAQAASSAHGELASAEVMDAMLRAQSTVSFPPADVAVGAAAIERVQEMIDEASGVIDGYLAKRYALPLGSVPKLVTAWARAIVRYKVNKDRMTDERTDPVVRDYRDALRMLEQVAKGSFSLGLEDPQGAAVQDDGDIRIHVGDKVFGRKHLP